MKTLIKNFSLCTVFGLLQSLIAMQPVDGDIFHVYTNTAPQQKKIEAEGSQKTLASFEARFKAINPAILTEEKLMFAYTELQKEAHSWIALAPDGHKDLSLYGIFSFKKKVALHETLYVVQKRINDLQNEHNQAVLQKEYEQLRTKMDDCFLDAIKHNMGDKHHMLLVQLGALVQKNTSQEEYERTLSEMDSCYLQPNEEEITEKKESSCNDRYEKLCAAAYHAQQECLSLCPNLEALD